MTETKAGKKPEPTYSPQMLTHIMERLSAPSEEGGKPPELIRDTVTFIVKPKHCLRGVYTEPFKLTIVEMTSKEMLAALAEGSMVVDKSGKVKGGGGAEGFLLSLGKGGLRDFNGRIMAPHEKDIIWETLKLPVHLACGKHYAEMVGLEVGMGELMDSPELG